MTTLAHDSKANYRPDIDGLRAIAVLAVVLFHIDASLIPGGFAGVDIFFVISGFLITGNIIKDAGSVQGFSWAEFYRRRALRILPVLFVVLLAEDSEGPRIRRYRSTSRCSCTSQLRAGAAARAQLA